MGFQGPRKSIRKDSLAFHIESREEWINSSGIIIQTDLYTKPTDKHQHLLSSSCHPQHTKTSIPFSLPLRIRRICSTNATFQIRINELKAYLLARGYHKYCLF